MKKRVRIRRKEGWIREPGRGEARAVRGVKKASGEASHNRTPVHAHGEKESGAKDKRRKTQKISKSRTRKRRC